MKRQGKVIRSDGKKKDWSFFRRRMVKSKTKKETKKETKNEVKAS